MSLPTPLSARRAHIVHELGWNYTVSTKHIETVLGWRARLLKETLVDMTESMIRLGIV